MKQFRFALALSLFGTLLLAGCPQNTLTTNAPTLARIGEFTVTASAPDADNLKKVAVHRSGSPAMQLTDPVRDVTPGLAKHDFPLPGCTSQTVEMFTGGANCCFGYYIMTACPDGQYAAYIEPQDGNLGLPVSTLKAYPVSDPSFMYYAKDALSFIRPDSPRLTRYLVFDGGKWRADKIGELKAVYHALASNALTDKTIDKTARAITVTYYSYMADTPESTLEKNFRAALPKEYRNLSASIFEDIKNAAKGFDPVKNIGE